MLYFIVFQGVSLPCFNLIHDHETGAVGTSLYAVNATGQNAGLDAYFGGTAATVASAGTAGGDVGPMMTSHLRLHDDDDTATLNSSTFDPHRRRNHAYDDDEMMWTTSRVDFQPRYILKDEHLRRRHHVVANEELELGFRHSANDEQLAHGLRSSVVNKEPVQGFVCSRMPGYDDDNDYRRRHYWRRRHSEVSMASLVVSSMRTWCPSIFVTSSSTSSSAAKVMTTTTEDSLVYPPHPEVVQFQRQVYGERSCQLNTSSLGETMTSDGENTFSYFGDTI